MTHEQKTISIQSQRTLQHLDWEDISQPGAYVEVATGDLYRIPPEGLLKGASPLIKKESAAASAFVQVSKNPYVLSLDARMVCAENNIQPNF